MPLADALQIKGQYKSACIISSIAAWWAIILMIFFKSLFPSDSIGFSILDKINPNTDPAESLVRLPSIGPARAELIIEYRSGGLRSFTDPDDLQNIRGIGPKTVDKIGPWLYFSSSDDN